MTPTDVDSDSLTDVQDACAMAATNMTLSANGSAAEQLDSDEDGRHEAVDECTALIIKYLQNEISFAAMLNEKSHVLQSSGLLRPVRLIKQN